MIEQLIESLHTVANKYPTKTDVKTFLDVLLLPSKYNDLIITINSDNYIIKTKRKSKLVILWELMNNDLDSLYTHKLKKIS